MPRHEFGLIGVRRGRPDESIVEGDDLEELVRSLSDVNPGRGYRAFKVVNYKHRGKVVVARGNDVEELRRIVRLKTGVR